jgi:hypothetical protein
VSGCGGDDSSVTVALIDTIPSLTPIEQKEADEYNDSSVAVALIDTIPLLTPIEQKEADEYVEKYRRDVLVQYVADSIEKGRFTPDDIYEIREDIEVNLVKYVKYFISQGADVNAKTYCRVVYPDLGTPLTPLQIVMGMSEIQHRHKSKRELGELGKLAKLLVSAGADVNAKYGDTNITPFSCAVGTMNLEDIKFFVSKGADVNCKSAEGKPLLDALREITTAWEDMPTLPSNASDDEKKDYMLRLKELKSIIKYLEGLK